MLRNLTLIVCLLFLVLSTGSALAQTADANISTAASEEIVDEVIVTGTATGRDKAMGAFFSGDYEQAEIEFEKNLERIQIRRSRLENAASRIATAEINAEIAKASGASLGGPELSDFATDSISGIADVGRMKDKSTNGAKKKGLTSGNDPGFQLYMAGLSELQQGKMIEAKKSFHRSVRMNGRNYDARYRLALLQILDKDYARARKQLAKIQKRLNACQKRRKHLCEEQPELEEAVTVINAALRDDSKI